MQSVEKNHGERTIAGRKMASLTRTKDLLGSSIKACLMASVVTTGFSLATVETASAQNFLQRLFNPEHQQRQRERQRQDELRQKVARTKVSAPRYLNYVPDSWKTVSLAALSEKKTAEVITEPDLADTADGATVEVDTAPAAPVVLTAFDEARPALKDMSLKALPEVGEALIAFYREHPDFVWVENGRPTVKAAKLRKALAAANKFALQPEDYFVSLPATAGMDRCGTRRRVDAV